MSEQYSEEVYLYAISRIEGLGPFKQKALIDYYQKASVVFKCDHLELSRHAYLNPKQIEMLTRVSCLKAYQKEISVIKKMGIKILNYDDSLFPERLKNSVSSPLQLFYKGDVCLLNEMHVLAVVGARKMTEYGRQVIKDFMKPLVDKGVVIVSGLAFGVDVCAHTQCLAHKGKTIAVLAQGVDKGYPRTHQREYENILNAGGLVVSEFSCLPHDEQEKFLFPRRNRIISGLSDAVLVIEAKEKSGALITARFANDQNRDVFAIPGGVYQPLSQGCLNLIKEGAKPVTSPQEILKEMGVTGENQKKKIDINSIPADAFESPLEKKIFEMCLNTPQILDDIIQQAFEPASYVSAMVTKMQLMGKIKELEGRRFVSVLPL